MAKPEKGSRKRKSKPTSCSLTTVLLLLPVLLFIFVLGIYIGSTFVQQHDPHQDSFRAPSFSGLSLPEIMAQRQLAPQQAPPPVIPEPVYDTSTVDQPSVALKAADRPSSPKAPQLVQTRPKEAGQPATEESEVSPSYFAHHSVELSSRSQVTFKQPIDFTPLSLALWVYLPPSSSSVGTMMTLLSNKRTGCDVGDANYGYALYVNDWETSNHKLVFEFGSSQSGCNKIHSERDFPFGEWVHLAVTVTAQSEISMYVNGELVGSGSDDVGMKAVQSREVLHMGRYPENQYPASANVSSLVAFQGAWSSADVKIVRLATIGGDANSIRTKLAQGFGDRLTDTKAGVFLFSDVVRTVKDSMGQLGEAALEREPTIVTVSEAGPSSSVPQPPSGMALGPVGQSRLSREESDHQGRQTAQRVKEAMSHAWKGYRTYAWGKDELKPLSKRGQNNWGGIGCTLVDSLDVLWLMGLRSEFDEATAWVRKSLSFDHAGQVSMFETTIRELGGLLAAFDASGDTVFLDKAEDLGRRLLKAFDTPSGIPVGRVSLSRGGSSGSLRSGSAVLAELGTLQVEFRYLSEMTGNAVYASKVNHVFDLMCSKRPSDGLYPIYVRTDNGAFTGKQITFGALGDSFYEYLLKVWLQGDKHEQRYRDTYDRAVDGMVRQLLHTSKPNHLAYIADADGRRLNHKMDHLVCFMGGSLALGAYTDPNGLDSPRAQRDLAIGKALTYTCYQMYARTATGIAAEWVQFRGNADFVPGAHFHILRPEAIESIFILHQLTGDPIYRQWGREMFDALEKYCRSPVAYASIPNVDSTAHKQDDRMESFFLAETLKYHYLLQAPLEDHGIDLLNSHVINTEAHPLSRQGTKRWEELRAIAQQRQ